MNPLGEFNGFQMTFYYTNSFIVVEHFKSYAVIKSAIDPCVRRLLWWSVLESKSPQRRKIFTHFFRLKCGSLRFHKDVFLALILWGFQLVQEERTEEP